MIKHTFVLYDKETESLWYPYQGELRGIQGEFFGRVLSEIPFEDTSWGDWAAENPKSKILR